MTASTPRTDSGGDDQRQALEDAERAASVQQPGSYKEEETDDKIVGIPRVGPGENPIRGLDSE